MAISKAEIEHLKDLARVEFNKKETEKLAKDLGEILGHVDELKKADISNVPEMTHALEGVKAPLSSRHGGITAKAVKNVFRKDEDESHPPADLTGAFPEKENNYLKVKPIL